MKITWSPALTLDGYIAKPNGDSDWVSDKDGELFNELVQKSGCVIVGRKTYEQYKGEVFPVKGAITYVWTQHPETGEPEESVEYISGQPQEVVARLQQKGHSEAVLAGGADTNNAFLSAGLVDEITATIYPLAFGQGMRLLSVADVELKLQLIDSQEIGDGIVRRTYKVQR